MQDFRFLHAADLHLDSPFRGLTGVPDPLRERVKASTFKALERLTELAIRERVDAVIISGDVYDAKDRSLRAQLEFQKAMEALAGNQIPAFLIHGNHDPKDEGFSARLRFPDSVHVFSSKQVESVVLKGRTGEAIARVSGISFGKAAETEDLSQGFRIYPDGLYHIGVLHTNVDGDAGHDNYAPCKRTELVGRGLDYWALGHIHTRAVLNERPWIVYPGNTQGRHIRESGTRGCYLVDVSSAGDAKLQFVPLEDVRWEEHTIAINELQTEQELKEALESAVHGLLTEHTEQAVIVRLVLEGRGSVHEVLSRAGVLSELTSYVRGYASSMGGEGQLWVASIDNRTVSGFELAELLEEPGFLGDLLRLSEEALASPALMAEIEEEALGPLLAQPQLRALLQAVDRKELADWLREAQYVAADWLKRGGMEGSP
jgi:DNA repair protein SbcD/Mre11